MPDHPYDLPGALLFALLFGIKHGFDADHLATIDGLARLQARQGRLRLARLSGALFSTGHGLVVLAAACLLQRFGIERLPAWLDPIGAWISIGFLLLIGASNLRNALRRRGLPPHHSALTRWALRIPVPNGWAASLAVGAVFALSFDSMTVAAWFGLAGARFGGLAPAILLALTFVAGMILTDALNGVFVAYLIGKSERLAERANRLFSVLVASSALLVAALGIARFSLPRVEAWSGGKELLFGAAIVALVLGAYGLARRQHRTAIASA